MASKGHSHGSGKIRQAPTAEAEPAHFDDDIDDDLPSADGPSRMSTSQCSTIYTIDSGRASSHSTLQSPEKNKGYLRSRKMVVCRISLLDGTTFEPKGIDKNATGQVIFDKVVQHLDLIETDYFGLTFRDKSGKKHWIDNSKKISNQVKGGTWVFEFQVKFYPPDPQSLKEDLTRYQLCLQVRVDIFNGRLPCSFVTYALLGSYTVQAELGDYIQEEYNGSIDYLKDFDFAPNQNLELLEKIAELHKYHKGQHPEEAESHFLENAKRLAMYGVDLHDVKIQEYKPLVLGICATISGKHVHDQENKPLVLGICASGILVYKDRLRINRFVWPKILKLEYKRNFFYVQVRPGILDPKEKTVGFRLDNHKLAKRLWKICVEHHAFFRLKDMEGGDAGTLFPRFNTKFRYSGRTQAQAKKAAEAQNREEPHIARTAERRSINKAKPLDMAEMQNKNNRDENDMYDKMKGDPTATATLSKEEEKKRKKEDERRRKEEEKEKLKQDFFQLLADTPDVGRQSKWNDVKHKIDKDPRYKAVGSNPQREEWFNEYIKNLGLKEEYMKMLKENPNIDRFSLWTDVKPMLENDDRYKAVPNDALREKWFDEYVKALEDKMKADFMQLLNDTPDINRHSKWNDVKHRIDDRDPRYQAVGSNSLREDWFNEYVRNIGVKEDFMQMLKEQPDITRHSKWNDVRPKLEKDPRYQAVDSNSRRERWFNEYLRRLEDKMKDDFMQLLADTPDITRHSKWGDVKHKIDKDPRYKAVDSNPQREDWFKEYVKNKGLKEDFMQMLADTPDITRHSRWKEVQPLVEKDPRYKAVDSNSRRERWFNEYLRKLDDQVKDDFMQLLADTPDITRDSKWADVKHKIDQDPRYQAVDSSHQREDWFKEYVKNKALKDDFMQLLQDTPDIDRHSKWDDVKDKIDTDPRYLAVNSNSKRERWFNEYKHRLEDEAKKGAGDDKKKYETDLDVILAGKGAITKDLGDDGKEKGKGKKEKGDSFKEKKGGLFGKFGKKSPTKKEKEEDFPPPLSPLSDQESMQQKKAGMMWALPGIEELKAKQEAKLEAGSQGGLAPGDYGMKPGDDKSIDRKMQFIPVVPPTVEHRDQKGLDPMPFFEPAGETDDSSLGRKGPPPIAKKPKAPGGYDSEEDRLMRRSGEIDVSQVTNSPPTVKTSSFKYTPNLDDRPMSTSKIPIVETKTHTVTYERDGVPFESEDSILISAHSYSTKSQTIDTTTYTTERNGVIETRVERKVIVTSDEMDDIDHDALLRAAIEEVTNMNPDMSVERIECIKQIEGEK